MHKLTLLSVCLAACATIAGPAAAKGKSAPACDAKYYSFLIGSDLTEARLITDVAYRALPMGSARGAVQPGRLTIVYDKKNRILEVACG